MLLYYFVPGQPVVLGAVGGLVLGGFDLGGGEGGHFHPLLGVIFIEEGLPFVLHRQDYYQANKCKSTIESTPPESARVKRCGVSACNC